MNTAKMADGETGPLWCESVVFNFIPIKFWRFYAVGFFTSAICWLLYEGLYMMHISQSFREAASWAVSYSLTSVLAHYLHYRITFDSRRNYWPSLWRTLLVYGTSMVCSSITDHLLVAYMHHRLAWAVNMSGFGLLNFFLLRYYSYGELLPTRFQASRPTDRVPGPSSDCG